MTRDSLRWQGVYPIEVEGNHDAAEGGKATKGKGCKHKVGPKGKGAPDPPDTISQDGQFEVGHYALVAYENSCVNARQMNKMACDSALLVHQESVRVAENSRLRSFIRAATLYEARMHAIQQIPKRGRGEETSSSGKEKGRTGNANKRICHG